MELLELKKRILSNSAIITTSEYEKLFENNDVRCCFKVHDSPLDIVSIRDYSKFIQKNNLISDEFSITEIKNKSKDYRFVKMDRVNEKRYSENFKVEVYQDAITKEVYEFIVTPCDL